MPDREKSRYKILEIRHVPKPLKSIIVGRTIIPLTPNDDKPINRKIEKDDKYKLKNKSVKSAEFLKVKTELNQLLINLSVFAFIPLAAKAPRNIPKHKNIRRTKKNLYLLMFSICNPNLKVFLSAIICTAISPFIKKYETSVTNITLIFRTQYMVNTALKHRI